MAVRGLHPPQHRRVNVQRSMSLVATKRDTTRPRSSDPLMRKSMIPMGSAKMLPPPQCRDEEKEEDFIVKNTPLEMAQRPRRGFSFIKKRPCEIVRSSRDLFYVCATRIQRLVTEMRECLIQIGCSGQATNQALEKWAIVIYESMSAPSRTFHSVQHVFDVAIHAGATQKLAAFFHDVIYYSIDGGLNPAQRDLLHDIIDENDGTVSITENTLDTNISMTMNIFGMAHGQILNPYKGLNEFLSACTAVRCYQESLGICWLAKIAACIEATIPFRPRDDLGRTPEEALFDRLMAANEKFNLGMSEKEVVKVVQQAADLANRDLANFTTPERAVFLSNTWNLLPESNISLRNTRVFRVSDFSLALIKMTGFFQFLDPESLYMSFRDEEHKASIKKKTEAARDNILIALTYMRCKSLAMGVIASIAELSGGDAPIALFLGDLPERHYASVCIEDILDVSYKPADGIESNEIVLQLLRDGREVESSFDVKNSPVSAFLYRHLGDEGLEKCIKHAVHPMDASNARALLKMIPKEVATEIVSACAEIATTRTEVLEQVIQELLNGDGDVE